MNATPPAISPGRVTVIDNDGTPLAPNVVLTQEFDPQNNRTRLAASIDGTPDFENTYQYNDLNWLTRIEQTSQPSGHPVADKRIDLTYNLVGQFDEITRYADLRADGAIHLLTARAGIASMLANMSTYRCCGPNFGRRSWLAR